jgi:hypothetical protein
MQKGQKNISEFSSEVRDEGFKLNQTIGTALRRTLDFKKLK